MYKRILILFSLLFLFQAESNSQQYFFRKYSVEEGLPLASVYCIIEDSRGYLWMGTAGGGLACFDGNKFETFTKANGLSDNLIYTLCEDSKGNIWIGTVNGLTLYDGENFTVLTDEPVLREATIRSITEGSNGIIWVGTMFNGLVAIRNDDSLSVTKFTIGEDLLSNMIFDIYEDHNKRLWLAMGHGVNTLTFSETDPLAIENIDDYYFPEDMVLSVEQGADDEFWISIHNKGIFNISGKAKSNDYEVVSSEINKKYPGLTVWDILLKENGEIWLATDENGVIRLLDNEVIGSFSRDNGLPSNQILNIMEDHEGNSWFASFGQGTLMFDDEKFLEYGPSEGISGNQVFSIYVESDDLLYTATETGFTCYKRDDRKITQLKSYSRPQGLNDVGATTLTKYRNNIWIGTNNGINIFNGTNLTGFEYNYLLPDLRISDLLVDNQNNLWIGTGGGYGKYTGDTLYLFTEDMGFINNEIQTIIEDSKERIWMGTFKGLVRLDTLYTDFNEEEGLTFTRINTLAEDPSGNIWIGTFGEGIFKYTDKSDTLPISFLAGKETLSSGTINSLFFINDSLLIAGTDKGFDLVELDSEQKIRNVIPYGRNDGFTGGEVNINAIARDDQGYIWFGTINGIIRFDPGLDQAYSSSSKTLITCSVS
jgi:ligand-binding sensor domain-containing protein